MEEEWMKPDHRRVVEVTEKEIAEVVSMWTGVPVHDLTEEETAKLLRMETVIHERIVGQDEAVTAVSKAIRRSRAGLKDPKRPAGSFIFLGPSGVGKTELAKALAEFLFGSEEALISLDMSEYMRSTPCRGSSGRLRATWASMKAASSRARPPPPLLGHPVRRDREGPPRRVQCAASDPRGGPSDRCAGPPRSTSRTPS